METKKQNAIRTNTEEEMTYFSGDLCSFQIIELTNRTNLL